MDEELEQLLEGNKNVDMDAFMDEVLNSQADPDTRIEPMTEDEFELKKRENGKGIEGSKDTPPPTPIRSPRTHTAPLSTDKETLQELTVIVQDTLSSSDKEKIKELTVTDPTPSSSSPKPITGRFRQYKSFIKQMDGRYGYLFGHLKKTFMPRKKFHKLAATLQSTMKEVLPLMVDSRVNEIAKKTVPLYVAEGLLLNRQNNQADVAAMIVEVVQKKRENLRAKITLQVTNAIANCIPSQVDSFLRNYMSNNIPHVHPTQAAGSSA
ncbi:hypothetical protein Tco_1452554 [Tanacetum coccineum]